MSDIRQEGDKTPSPGNGYRLVIRRGEAPRFERDESRDDKTVFVVDERVTNEDLLTAALARHNSVAVDLKLEDT